MHYINENIIEESAIEKLKSQGWRYLHGLSINPEGENKQRDNFDEVILKDIFITAIKKINPKLNNNTILDAYNKVIRLQENDLILSNEKFHKYLTEGVDVEYRTSDGMRGEKVFLINFEHPDKNDFLAVNQFTVIENKVNKRLDLVLFVNGLPIVAFELKNPVDEKATLHNAFIQFQNYKNAITAFFNYNAFLIISDGIDAKTGTISSDYNRFMAWRSRDGIKETEKEAELDVLIEGMLKKDVLLDLIKHFIIFDKETREDKNKIISEIKIKKISAYHQYYATNKAVNKTISAVSENGNKKGGVIWHTQGSGKSLTMLFYAGKLILKLKNPTIVVITDRNDLDDQLFETFVNGKSILRQTPIQISSRVDLKEKLKVTAGGVFFATIQKFFPSQDELKFPHLSDRRNIVVIADEAHRTQYGFEAKLKYMFDKQGVAIGVTEKYGLAKHLRDALPNATYIGFTGTPIELKDRNTQEVFGKILDVYDIASSLHDKATVKIYYESRLAKVRLKEENRILLDDELDEYMEENQLDFAQRDKAKWARVEAVVGNQSRVKDIATDIVTHFENRNEVTVGKAMIVTMSRRIAVLLYDELAKIRPNWIDDNDKNGMLKIVMTGSSSDPIEFQKHIRTKEQKKFISTRFKNPDDELQMVIVCDMWLTGFDVPCLHTMYIDKPLKGHTLMQAITRVNRVFKDKPGGLIVDYLGIADELRKSLENYTASGGEGKPTFDIEDAINSMQTNLQIIKDMMHGFNYERYFKANISEKLQIIIDAQEFVLNLDKGKERFIDAVSKTSQSFALCKTSEIAEKYSLVIAFFQAIKSRLVKYEIGKNKVTDVEIETTIRQLVDKALVTEGVIDLFAAAGIKKPDISILSDEFLNEIKGMKHKNICMELLKKILHTEIKGRSKFNLVRYKKFSEMLDNAVKKYQTNMISSVEIINELIKIAKEIRDDDNRKVNFNLTDDELAFYDALAENENARDVMKDETLRTMAHLLVEKLKASTTIDWTIRESVKAKLRITVKRILREHGYPPDVPGTKEYTISVDRVLNQAEMLADYWMNTN